MDEQSKSTLVDSLGINILRVDIGYNEYDHRDVVLVHDLEAALQKLPKITGIINESYGFSGCENPPGSGHTHEARLFGLTEIRKEPLKISTEVIINQDGIFAIGKSFVGKKVSVTVEQIE